VNNKYLGYIADIQNPFHHYVIGGVLGVLYIVVVWLIISIFNYGATAFLLAITTAVGGYLWLRSLSRYIGLGFLLSFTMPIVAISMLFVELVVHPAEM